MSYEIYYRYTRVQHDAKFGDVIVSGFQCRECRRDEVLTVLNVADVMPGDELEGCSKLAMDYKREEGWVHYIARGSTREFVYCPECWAKIEGVADVYHSTVKEAQSG